MGPRSPYARLALGAFALAFTALAGAVPPPIAAEHLDISRLPARSPHWIYVLDNALYNETDSRVYLYDGDAHRMLGQIGAGYYPGFSVSPDGLTSAVATTYWARGSHGARTDVIEFTDNRTLVLKSEIVLPPKRAQTLSTLYNTAYSADQKFFYSTNLNPVASYEVIDLAKGAVVSEIDTDGCVQVFPSGQRRVSSLCENGRLLTVTIGEDGKEASRSASAPFFNVDKDPIFVQAMPTTNGLLFLSFHGDVYGADLSAAEPRFAPTWSLVTAAERNHWRPGGSFVGAFQKKTGRLYVPMHQGSEGSHKVGGKEIWVYDTATHQRVARWPIDEKRFGPTVAIQVTQDDKPLLFVTTENAAMLVMDATTGKVTHVEAKMGQTPWLLINP